MTSSQLENLIEIYRTLGCLETDPRRARDAFERMRELIGERSPERVEQMERERGLRA
jgi:hypothetical protein